jgi:hypothetical protein
MGVLKSVGSYLTARAVIALVCIGALAAGIGALRSRATRVDLVRRIMANRAAREIVLDLQKRYPNASFVVFDFAGDYNGYMAEQLRAELRRVGKVVAAPASRVTKAIAALRPRDGMATPEEAAGEARKLDADVAVYGRIDEFDRLGRRGSLRMDVRAAEAATGEETVQRALAVEWPATSMDRVVMLGAGWRLLIWIGAALVLPLLAYPLARATLERESNALTFSLLAGLTVLDIAVALLMLGFAVYSVWTALLVIAAFLVGAAYNYIVLNSYEKMRA